MHRSLFLNVAQEYTEKRDKYLKVSDRHLPKLHQLAVAEEQFLGCGPSRFHRHVSYDWDAFGQPSK